MIVKEADYKANLALINNPNPPPFAVLNPSEPIYQIDINSRKVLIPTTPINLVERDHQSEVIYFEVDRFVDYVDLASTTCIISYNNAKKQGGQYFVPFYDITTNSANNKLIFPWRISSRATAADGTLEFSIQFFKIGEKLNPNNNAIEKIISYSLNTVPAKIQILKGLKLGQMDDYDEELKADIMQDIADIVRQLKAQVETPMLYWSKIDSNGNIVTSAPETTVNTTTYPVQELQNIVK